MCFWHRKRANCIPLLISCSELWILLLSSSQFPPCVVYQKKKSFYFLFQTKVWPLCQLLHPPPPLTPPLTLSVSLCIDNVLANDFTALIETPSSNWTSWDRVLYWKTIVIIIWDLHCTEIQQDTALDWTLWSKLRGRIKERKKIQLCVFFFIFIFILINFIFCLQKQTRHK